MRICSGASSNFSPVLLQILTNPLTLSVRRTRPKCAGSWPSSLALGQPTAMGDVRMRCSSVTVVVSSERV
jgi:hypothetical protein